MPKTALVDPNAFIAPKEIPTEIPAPEEDIPVFNMSGIVGGVAGGVAGGIPGGVAGGVVGGILNDLNKVAAPPPPPPKKRAPPKQIGGNVLKSKLIRQVEPEYPELARRARVQGIVILVVNVDEEGNVAEIQVTRGHPLLKDAAVAAVKQWKYSPTLLNGEPIQVTATVTVNFVMGK